MLSDKMDELLTAAMVMNGILLMSRTRKIFVWWTAMERSCHAEIEIDIFTGNA